jgi:putative transposase
MGDLKRYHEDGCAYFISTVCDNRREVFKDISACKLLISVLIYNKFTDDFKIYGFVIMPDHLHVILRPCGKEDISKIVKDIKGTFSRFYNKINCSTGTVWQKGFYDNGIRDIKQLEEMIIYIHNNSVNEGIVAEAGEYVYSSYRYYYMNDERFKTHLPHP